MATFRSSSNDASVEFEVNDTSGEVSEIRASVGPRRSVRVVVGGQEYVVAARSTQTITTVAADRVRTVTDARSRVSVPHVVFW